MRLKILCECCLSSSAVLWRYQAISRKR